MNIFSCFKLGTTTDKTTEYSDYNIYLVNYSSSNNLMMDGGLQQSRISRSEFLDGGLNIIERRYISLLDFG